MEDDKNITYVLMDNFCPYFRKDLLFFFMFHCFKRFLHIVSYFITKLTFFRRCRGLPGNKNLISSITRINPGKLHQGSRSRGIPGYRSLISSITRINPGKLHQGSRSRGLPNFRNLISSVIWINPGKPN